MRMILFALGLVLLAGFEPSWSATLKVPEEYATISDAIGKAGPGDTISVGPGVYSGNLLVTVPLHLVSRESLGAEIVGEERAQPVIKFDSVEGSASIEGFKINGNARSAAGVEVVASDLRIVGNEIYFTTVGALFRRSSGEVLRNHFRDNFGGEMNILGSSPLVAENRFVGAASCAIEIIGKESAPTIGGAPGRGNEFGPGYLVLLTNGTRNDIDARYNQWSWSATVEMDAQPYPSTITAIFDGFDDITKGKVDYSHWVGAEAGARVQRLPWVVILAAVALCAVALVLWLLRRGRKGSA